MPKVSIIVPVYNVQEYLVKCVDSICNQTFTDIEIILVNDGSTDGCNEILEDFMRKDERIILINKFNGGLSSARNKGIDVAKGEYIAFVDSDDWIDLEYIEKLYRVCVKYNCDIAQCSYKDIINDNFNMEKNIVSGDRMPILYTGREFSYAMYTLLSWQCNLVWNKLYKKALFDDIRFPIGKIHEDEFITYKLVWKANKIGVISNQLYYYRYRAGSIMHQAYSKNRFNADEAFFERENFYRNLGEKELLSLASERHMDWLQKQKGAIAGMDAGSRKDILNYIERQENVLKKELVEDRWSKNIVQIDDNVFPFGKVEKGSSIIIYGGGNVARKYYRQVYLQDYCDVVLWVDKDVKRCRQQGIPVVDVEEIVPLEKEWNYIVIAIGNIEDISEVMRMLVDDYHISAKKIIY